MPKPLLMIPIAGTIADNAVRNVSPNIVGNTRSWYAFVENEVKAAKLAAGASAQVMIHMPQGNDRRILDGKYCADAFYQCQKRVRGDDGAWVPPYRVLSQGFVEAFRGQRIGCYVGCPEYRPLGLDLGKSYRPYANTFDFLVLDHCTVWPDPTEVTRLAAGRTIMVEGGGPADIARWPAEVGWFLESRSPWLFTNATFEIAKTRRVVCYCGFGSATQRATVAVEAVTHGFDPCIVYNDLDEFNVEGVTIEYLAGVER